MLANIRAVVRTAALSVGATGLIALGSSLISGLPSSTGLDGLGVALPAVSTDALEIDLAGAHTPDLSAPTIHEETLSRPLGTAALPDENTVIALLHQAGSHHLVPQQENAALSGPGAGAAEGAQHSASGQARAGQSPAADYATSVRPSGSKRARAGQNADVTDPAESLGLSTEGLLGKGLLGEGLTL